MLEFAISILNPEVSKVKYLGTNLDGFSICVLDVMSISPSVHVTKVDLGVEG